jgi:hypothetical protein
MSEKITNINSYPFSVEQIYSQKYGLGELHIPQKIFDDVSLPFSKYSLAIFRSESNILDQAGFTKKKLVNKKEAQQLTNNFYQKTNQMYTFCDEYLDACYNQNSKIVTEPPKNS